MEIYGIILFMKKIFSFKKPEVNFTEAQLKLASELGCSENELKVAIETCNYIVKNVSFILKSERGIVWPYDFFDYWNGKSMLEHGNANPFLVGKILSSCMLEKGIYIYTSQGKQIKDGELIVCDVNLNYYIVAPSLNKGFA